jgi:hypothetical protein
MLYRQIISPLSSENHLRTTFLFAKRGAGGELSEKAKEVMGVCSTGAAFL